MSKSPQTRSAYASERSSTRQARVPTKSQLTPPVKRALAKLGEDIDIARRKRRMPVVDLVGAAGISESTYRRLVKGDPAVSLGAFLMVLMVLGEIHRVKDLLDVSSDTAGLVLDIARLPKRVRRSKGDPVGL